MTPATDDIRRAFGFAGAAVAQRQRGRVMLTYFADVDCDEVARRVQAGIGAIVDRRVINALWEVPADLDFPRDALPDWVVDRLIGIEAANVGATVRRRVRPPLTIRAAAAVGPNLSRLLDVLGPLSSVCATAAVLTRRAPDPDAPGLMDARLFGVAVGVASKGTIRVLNEPQPVLGDVGAYQWHVAELVYSEIAAAT